MEPTNAPKSTPAPAMAKYKIKGDKKSVMYPGFKHEVTAEHLSGEHAELFVKAFKNLDKKSGKDNFALFIEESK